MLMITWSQAVSGPWFVGDIWLSVWVGWRRHVVRTGGVEEPNTTLRLHGSAPGTPSTATTAGRHLSRHRGGPVDLPHRL